MQPRFLREILLGIKNLLLHKLRSILTMLGVVFGVGSVVAMLSVGEGASREALDQIRRLGSTNIIITSVPPVEEVGGGQRSRLSLYGLTYEDERRIREAFPAVAQTVPSKIVRKEGRLGELVMELRVVGTTPEWFQLVQRPTIAGRVLVQRDMQTASSPVVLTDYGARRLLASAATIGQTIRIGNDYFEVVGIIRSDAAAGAGGIQTPDQEVDAYIPINIARERFGDINVKRTAGGMERERVELHQLIVQARSTDDVEATAAGIESMLAHHHRKKDYRMAIPLALLREAEATKRRFNIVLGSIAGISLLVGGIGIMNIMLASVTERTREIGIRRAIGAKRKQIISQFLIETVVLSTIGGLIGIAIGIAIPQAITYFAQMPTIVTPSSVILAVGISMAVGIIFGLYPAVRAANLDPIVALRHE